jgi:hypothetical protein
MPSFPKWVKGDAKGHDHLARFSSYYFCIRRIAERYGLRPMTVIYLIEVYLGENDEAHDKTENATGIHTPEVYAYINNAGTGTEELNAEGWKVIRSLLFTIRKRIELMRERRGRIIQ